MSFLKQGLQSREEFLSTVVLVSGIQIGKGRIQAFHFRPVNITISEESWFLLVVVPSIQLQRKFPQEVNQEITWKMLECQTTLIMNLWKNCCYAWLEEHHTIHILPLQLRKKWKRLWKERRQCSHATICLHRQEQQETWNGGQQRQQKLSHYIGTCVWRTHF